MTVNNDWTYQFKKKTPRIVIFYLRETKYVVLKNFGRAYSDRLGRHILLEWSTICRFTITLTD